MHVPDGTMVISSYPSSLHSSSPSSPHVSRRLGSAFSSYSSSSSGVGVGMPRGGEAIVGDVSCRYGGCPLEPCRTDAATVSVKSSASGMVFNQSIEEDDGAEAASSAPLEPSVTLFVIDSAVVVGCAGGIKKQEGTAEGVLG